MSYDNDGQIIVSKVISSKRDAPTLRAQVEKDGVTYEAGLWPWTRKDGSKVLDKNGNQQYKGKLKESEYKPKMETDRFGAAAGADDFDNEIPF